MERQANARISPSAVPDRNQTPEFATTDFTDDTDESRKGDNFLLWRGFLTTPLLRPIGLYPDHYPQMHTDERCSIAATKSETKESTPGRLSATTPARGTEDIEIKGLKCLSGQKSLQRS
jgi:hypothetical protein